MQKLLYEDIDYDYAINNGIAVVAESDVFLYKKNKEDSNIFLEDCAIDDEKC